MRSFTTEMRDLVLTLRRNIKVKLANKEATKRSETYLREERTCQTNPPTSLGLTETIYPLSTTAMEGLLFLVQENLAFDCG